MVSSVIICITSLAVLTLGIVMDWNCIHCCYLYVILTCSCLLIGPLIMILINIALSPKHQTGSGTVRTTMEMDAFRNMLMVYSYIFFYKKCFFTMVDKIRNYEFI